MNVLLGALRSKTIWVNALLAAINAFTNGLSDVGLDPETYSLIQIVANIVIRAITSGSLAEKGRELAARIGL